MLPRHPSPALDAPPAPPRGVPPALLLLPARPGLAAVVSAAAADTVPPAPRVATAGEEEGRLLGLPVAAGALPGRDFVADAARGAELAVAAEAARALRLEICGGVGVSSPEFSPDAAAAGVADAAARGAFRAVFLRPSPLLSRAGDRGAGGGWKMREETTAAGADARAGAPLLLLLLPLLLPLPLPLPPRPLGDIGATFALDVALAAAAEAAAAAFGGALPFFSPVTGGDEDEDEVGVADSRDPSEDFLVAAVAVDRARGRESGGARAASADSARFLRSDFPFAVVASTITDAGALANVVRLADLSFLLASALKRVSPSGVPPSFLPFGNCFLSLDLVPGTFFTAAATAGTGADARDFFGGGKEALRSAVDAAGAGRAVPAGLLFLGEPTSPLRICVRVSTPGSE